MHRAIDQLSNVAKGLGFNVSKVYEHSWDTDLLTDDEGTLIISSNSIHPISCHLVSRDYLTIGDNNFHPHIEYKSSEVAFETSVKDLMKLEV